MPWEEKRPVEQRFEFVLAAEKGEESMAALCREFGISRQTGYKWLKRYREDPSPQALVDRSRRPFNSPHQVDGEIAEMVLRARRHFAPWGPRKLYAWLVDKYPDRAWPSPASIGRLLKRRGLVKPRKRRRRTPPYTRPFAEVTAPNQVWCIDFKGHFCTGDGTCVYPLTITDAYSRFVLACDIVLAPNSAEVRDILERVFRTYGLPEAIRSDNGPPFASTGPGGLTELSGRCVVSSAASTAGASSSTRSGRTRPSVMRSQPSYMRPQQSSFPRSSREMTTRLTSSARP